MRRLLLVLMFYFLFSTSFSFSQDYFTSTGMVVNSITGDPLPYVVLSWEKGQRHLSNSDGYFELKGREGVDSILIIEHIGYQPIKFHGSEIDSIVNLTPTEVVSFKTSKPPLPSLRQALGAITSNYHTDPHLLFGLYQEELHQNESLIQYGEGYLKSLKTGYKNNPQFDTAFLFQQNDICISGKGFQSSIGESKVDIPISSRAKYLPKILDPLTALRSPLLAENLDNIIAKWGESIRYNNEMATYLYFSFDGMNESTNGKILLGDSSNIIYNIQMTESFGHNLMDSVQWSGVYQRTTDVRFASMGKRMGLSFISTEEESVFDQSMQPYISKCVYFTDKLVSPLLSEVNKSNLLLQDYPVYPFIPLQTKLYYKHLPHILRPREVVEALGNGSSIVYRNSNLDKLLLEAQQEEKLLFYFVYETNDIPSKRMQTNTLKVQELVHLLNEEFVCGQVNLSREPDHEIIYEADLQFTPSVVIMTPLGQLLEVIDGYILPGILIRKLKSYEQLDIPGLFYAYDSSDGSDRKKLESAYMDLFLQLAKMDHPKARSFLDVYIQKNKDWDDPAAKNIIFKYLVGKADRQFDKKFLKDQEYYIARYGEQAVLQKISDLAERQVSYNNIRKHKKYFDFVEDYAPHQADSLYSVYLVKYFSSIFPDKKKYFNAIHKYFNNYNSDWTFASQHLLTIAFYAEEGIELNQIQGILKNYEENSIKHEYLDILSVLLYRQGKKQEALKLIPKIKKLALAQGINYIIALTRLQNSEDKEEEK